MPSKGCRTPSERSGTLHEAMKAPGKWGVAVWGGQSVVLTLGSTWARATTVSYPKNKAKMYTCLQALFHVQKLQQVTTGSRSQNNMALLFAGHVVSANLECDPGLTAAVWDMHRECL